MDISMLLWVLAAFVIGALFSLFLVSCFMLSGMISREEEDKEDYREW